MSQVKIRAALESALIALGGIIPTFNIQTVTAGALTKITSVTPHGLKTGVSVTISGNVGGTPDLNGCYFVNVIDAYNFALLGSTTEAPVASTASGVGGVCKANLTAWDNVSFKPVPGVPYQRVAVLFGAPENPTMGSDFYREVGYMQVSLLYPIGKSPFDVITRAEMIRSAFKRGSSFVKDGIVVNIIATPEIMPGMPVDESYAVPIRIRFRADIFN